MWPEVTDNALWSGVGFVAGCYARSVYDLLRDLRRRTSHLEEVLVDDDS